MEDQQIEIEKDGVKLKVEPSSTNSTILIEVNGQYVGDIRPALDSEGNPSAILFSSCLIEDHVGGNEYHMVRKPE